MKMRNWLLASALIVASTAAGAAEPQAVKEVSFAAPNDVTMKLRMEGPYTADVPLQVVCYFKYTPAGAKRMTGAPVELDKELGGVIGAMRERGEFVGDELETLLIIPPSGSIKAKALLLIGLGNESSLSIDVTERVGKVAVREASRLGVHRVGFAPLIRDQGNSTLDTGEIERAVIRGVLLAYDTDKRMQKQGLSKPFTLEQPLPRPLGWIKPPIIRPRERLRACVEAVQRAGSEPIKSCTSEGGKLFTATDRCSGAFPGAWAPKTVYRASRALP